MNASSSPERESIDAEFFFREFLARDPKYRAVIPVLDKLRGGVATFLGEGRLSLSEFIDLVSAEYDTHGDLIPKEEDLMRVLGKAMKQCDVTRETLRIAAGSGLTPAQIEEGPTSIKIPASIAIGGWGFRQFVQSLSPEYGDCENFCSLMRSVYGLRLHQKPIFLLFDEQGDVVAYFSPDWSMLEMREGIALDEDQEVARIYSAKVSIKEMERLISENPRGHVKIVYIGKDKRR